jgi:hypothetical protein
MEFNDGDRVRHIDWGNTGTVRLFPDAGPDEAQGEVRWDGSFVASRLELF